MTNAEIIRYLENVKMYHVQESHTSQGRAEKYANILLSIEKGLFQELLNPEKMTQEKAYGAWFSSIALANREKSFAQEIDTIISEIKKHD